MATLGALEIQMYADLARLRQDMDQAKGVVKGATDAMSSAFAALGVTLSAAAFGNWIKGAINAADEANKMAQKIGVTTDKVAGLQLAFEQSGAGGADVMQRAMSKLSVGLVEGNKTLEALGIKAKDSREALALIADQFQRLPDGVQKSAAAAGIFGEKLGANMIPLLNAGSEGLREMDQLAGDLGLTIDRELGAAAESFNDHMEQVQKSTEGVALSILNELMPALEVVARGMAEGVKHGGAFAGIGTALSVAFESLVVLGSDVAFVLKGIGREIGGIAAQAAAVARLDFSGAAAIGDMLRHDAQLERDRLDAFQRRILQARELSEITRNAAEHDEPRFKRAMEDANKAAAERTKILGTSADAYKKAAAEAKKLADAENDRLSKRGLADLRRQDEAEVEAERATLARIKAEQDWLSQRSLQELKRNDEAEAAADERWQKEVETAKRAQEKIDAEWQKSVDQMAQSFTDALMSGGKSVADYLRDLFRTLVLRPVLMPAGSAAASFVSGPAAASGGGGGGMMGSIGSALGGIGGFGTAAGAGLSAVLGGAGLGNVLGASGAAISAGLGTGALGTAAAGLGLGLGAIAPVVAAAYGLYVVGKKLFGRELKDTGISGNFSAEDGFAGQAYKFYKGGWLRKDKTKRSALDPSIDAALDAGAQAATATVQQYAELLGLPVKAIEGYTQKLKLSLKGLSSQEIQEALAGAVADFGEGLASQFAPALELFRKAGESLGDTLQRLATLQSFSNTLADLGGVFERVARLSVDAREGFIAMAGGMDALGAKALGFVQDYYGRDEIAGIKAAEIKDALAAVGITQDVNSRDDFRKLVDSTDISTELGREQLAALLNMASAFTSVADYLTETGATLSSAAAQSPSTGATAALFAPSGQGETVLAINGVAFWVQAVLDAIKQQTAIMQSGSASVATSTAGGEVNSWNPATYADGTWYDRN